MGLGLFLSCSPVSCLLRRGETGTHGHCYLGALPTPRTGLDPREEGRSRRGREPESGYLRDRWHTQPGKVAEGGVERPPLVVQGLTYSPLCYDKGVSSSTRHGSTRMELHPRLGLSRPAAGPAGRWPDRSTTGRCSYPGNRKRWLRRPRPGRLLHVRVGRRTPRAPPERLY